MIEAKPVDPRVHAEVREEESEARGILEEMEAFQISDQGDLDFAAQVLREVKTKKSELEDKRSRVTKPLSQALEEVRSWFRPAVKLLGSIESQMKQKIAAAHEELYAAQQAALEDASAAAREGRTEDAQAAMARVQEGDFSTPKGVQLRHSYTFEVVDEDAIPREYLWVNEGAVMRAVLKFKDKTNIPGIKVVRKTTVAAKTKG